MPEQVAPQESDQSGQGRPSTESVIYGYSTVASEVVNTVGARVWTGTETRSTWVPISTTMVPAQEAPASPPPTEGSPVPELHWVPSAVVETVVQSDATATWTKTSTATTWVQMPATRTLASEAQQTQETTSTTSLAESATQTIGQTPPEGSEVPPTATPALAGEDQSMTGTETATLPQEVSASATEMSAPEATEQVIAR